MERRRCAPCRWSLQACVLVVVLAWCLGWPGTMARAQPNCSLALVLAIDVSSSVDERDYRLQMQGLASAFGDPTIQQAIVGVGGILVTAFEWSGRRQQVEIAPWTFLANQTDIAGFANRITRHPRRYNAFPTALGYALGHAAGRLQQAPLRCARQVIDVSGDGVNNDGFGPDLAFVNFPFDNVQVNALVIAGATPDPVSFFRREVIRGPGAFIEVANGFRDFEAAMKRKLLREIIGGAFSMQTQPVLR